MIVRAVTLVLVLAIRVYQVVLSPLLGDCCRFEPSCSKYALQALDKHGLIAGSVLAIKRVIRCNPRNSGGIDPVPPN